MMRRTFACACCRPAGGCGACCPTSRSARPTYDLAPRRGRRRRTPPGAPLVLPDLEVNGALEGTALLYRLAYADAFQLRPYAYARWSAPPGAAAARSACATTSGATGPILDFGGRRLAGAARRRPPPVLRVELEEFSHLFESRAASQGVVRVRCTLLENSAGRGAAGGAAHFTVAAAGAHRRRGRRRARPERGHRRRGRDIAAWLRQPR